MRLNKHRLREVYNTLSEHWICIRCWRMYRNLVEPMERVCGGH